MGGEALRDPLEVGVAPPAPAALDRQPVGPAAGDAGEELVDRFALRRVGLGAAGAPLPQHLVALGGGGDRQLRDAAAGVLDDRAEQDLEAAQPAPDGGGVEESAAEHGVDRPARIAGQDRDVEVHLGGARVALEARDLEARQLWKGEGLGVVSDAEEDLEQGIAPGLALGLELGHQAVERQVGALERFAGDAPHSGEQVPEARPSGQVGAQHDRVDEETDDLADAEPVAGVRRGPHGHVVLPGEPAEQGLEGGEQEHERGDALFAGEPQERPSELAVQVPEQPQAGRIGPPGPGPVRGQLEEPEPGETAAPVGELLLEPAALEAPAPVGLDLLVERGRRRQADGPSGVEGAVEKPQLAQDDLEGAAVGDHVVDRQQ